MTTKRKHQKDVVVAQVYLPQGLLTPEKFSEILAKLGENESVEIFQGGKIQFNRRKETGGKETIPLKNNLFVGLSPQDHVSHGRMIIPIDGSYDYADRHAKTRKEANRNEKLQKATFTGIMFQLQLEDVKPVECEFQFSTYWRFTLSNGVLVFTPVGNKEKIVMIKRPGEDYQFNPY